MSEERRRDRLQEWKNEQRSIQLLKVLGEKIGWNESERDSIGEDLTSAFGTLYASFEEAAMNESAIIDAGFEGDWIKEFVEIAIENIIPPFVEIKGSLNLSINIENGVQVIKEALQAAEDFTSGKDEISVMCFYDGAPEYRIVLKAPDFKTAEDLWVEVSETIVEKWKKVVDKQLVLGINTDLIINDNYYAINMARQLLQQCVECQAWTFERKCPHCEGPANAAAPIKWSLKIREPTSVVKCIMLNRRIGWILYRN